MTPLPDDEPTAAFGFDEDLDAWTRRVARAVQPVDEGSLGEIGGFRLLAVVARGGQGTVYRAIEPGTGRTVAVKRLHQETPGSSARARFDREAEIVASLRHPGIVTLLASHEIRSQRILIMEWIDGLPIDRWADGEREAHAPADATRRIVATFVALTDAIAHAHRNGVIHRDLKPTNLLVDTSGAPHVLDFGLALPFGRDATAITQVSGFLGTPTYAAPEQVTSAHVDARADVHAVGAMLYRCLSGTHPFDERASLPELFRQIAETDPAPPSRVAPAIGRELSLVCMKALAKEPARRYQSIEALGDDLRRWIANEPVTAHPTEFGYLLQKSFVRHRAAFLVAGVAAATLLAATVALAMLALSLAKEREDLSNARIEEQVAKVAAQAGATEAMRRAREAERATESALRARDFLQRIFGAMQEAGIDGASFSVEATLDLARDELAFERRPPAIEAELRETLGAAFEGFADADEAAREYAESVRLLLTIPEPERDPDLLARARLGFGRSLSLLGRHRAALEPLTSALAWFETMRDDALRSDALRLIAASIASIEGPQFALPIAENAIDAAIAAGDDIRVGSAMSTKAVILNELGREREATEVAAASVQCLRERIAPDHPELARALHNDADLALTAGLWERAIDSAREAMAIRAANYGEGSPTLLGTAGILVRALRGAGRTEEAIAEGRALAEPALTNRSIAARAVHLEYHLLRMIEAREDPADLKEMLERTRRAIDLALEEEGAFSMRAGDLLRCRIRALFRSAGRAAVLDALESEPRHWLARTGDADLAHGLSMLGIVRGAMEVGSLDPAEAVSRMERLAAELTPALAAHDREDPTTEITLLLTLSSAREATGDRTGAIAAAESAERIARTRTGEAGGLTRLAMAARRKLEPR
jgi:hypothetical protein